MKYGHRSNYAQAGRDDGRRNCYSLAEKRRREYKKREGLLEIMTEKATYEIEAPQDGVFLKVLVRENEVRPIGHFLAVVGKKDEDISDLLSQAERIAEKKGKKEVLKKEEVPTVEREAPRPGRIRISPAAKRLAKEEGVDLSRIKGSGPEGRIIRADILEAVRQKKEPPPKGKLVTLTGIKKLTAERLSESFKTAPHFSVSIDVDMKGVLDLIKKMAPEVERKFSAPLSYCCFYQRSSQGTKRSPPHELQIREGED